MAEIERIPAARVTDNDTGNVYELDFSRESISFAEGRGFVIDNVVKFPVTGISDLFYYSFRMHHRRVARDKTDDMIKRWGGLPKKLIERLLQLYDQAQSANVIQDEEDEAKNAKVTLEL